MGFKAMANQMVWPPSLSRDRSNARIRRWWSAFYRACKLFIIRHYVSTTSGDIVVCFHTAVCL